MSLFSSDKLDVKQNDKVYLLWDTEGAKKKNKKKDQKTSPNRVTKPMTVSPAIL